MTFCEHRKNDTVFLSSPFLDTNSADLMTRKGHLSLSLTFKSRSVLLLLKILKLSPGDQSVTQWVSLSVCLHSCDTSYYSTLLGVPITDLNLDLSLLLLLSWSRKVVVVVVVGSWRQSSPHLSSSSSSFPHHSKTVSLCRSHRNRWAESSSVSAITTVTATVCLSNRN